tara:strand:- start:938 stop:1228 length:291 start_codon:yes stop_codon:yes gene_type:complete
MGKVWKILLLISILGGGLFWLLNKFETAGKNAEKVEIKTRVIEEQKQEIKKVHEVIETKRNQQKIISKSSDNINIAARTEWMRLIFEERNSSPKTD